MKQVDEMPTSGQFVAVWEHDGEMWCETLKWKRDKLFAYSREDDEFGDLVLPSHYKTATFFVM